MQLAEERDQGMKANLEKNGRERFVCNEGQLILEGVAKFSAEEDRNNLEKLTLAVLSHLPTAVLYVHDLTGECGTSPSDQFSIYKGIREKFTGHLWLDVVSKSDLLKTSPVLYATEEAYPTEQELEKYRKSGPDGAINVSVKTQEGLHELKHRVHELLNLQMTKIKDISNNQESHSKITSNL